MPVFVLHILSSISLTEYLEIIKWGYKDLLKLSTKMSNTNKDSSLHLHQEVKLFTGIFHRFSFTFKTLFSRAFINNCFQLMN